MNKQENDDLKESSASYGGYGASVAEQKRGYLVEEMDEHAHCHHHHLMEMEKPPGGFCGRARGWERL